jgi:hypothetical protein
MLEMKTDITLVDNEFITLKHVAEGDYIYHVIHKPISFETFREALDIGAEALKDKGCVKWLSDDRKNGPLSEKQQKWAQEDWIPRTIQAGWKFRAVVVPTELISAGSLMPVINGLYEYGLRMAVFASHEEAVEWLSKM